MPVPIKNPLPERSLLREDAYRAILDAIMTGQLVPGERLRDSELERWLGFSRTPIREALLRLERVGLVVARPGRGTTVAPYDPDLTRQARQVAASLHALATELAVPRLTASDISKLEEANAALASVAGGADVSDAIAADDRFHDVFTQAAGNPVLGEQLAQVMPMLRRAEYLHFDSLANRPSIKQHAEVIAACRAGNVNEAAARVRDNWQSLQE